MIDKLPLDKCTGCMSCFNSCPKSAIFCFENEEGFIFPKINHNLCIHCDLCESACPILNNNNFNNMNEAYASFSNIDEIRSISSSGGVFGTIAYVVIKNGGVVYGSYLAPNMVAKHIRVDKTEELHQIIGSKYMQSEISDIFKSVKSDLVLNKKVLFCGTSCQIAGLKKYLNKTYDNLLTIDFICEGVPSPLIWKEYLKLKKINKIKSCNFKDKKYGWHLFSLRVIGNRLISDIGITNGYFYGYFKGLYSRKCCEMCKFKSKYERISDITLSDCWGYNKIAPDLDDNKGLSCVVIHTINGHNYFNQVSRYLTSKNINIEDIFTFNPNYYTSKKIDKNNREEFWETYKKDGYKSAYNYFCKNPRYKGIVGLFRKIKLKFLNNYKIR